MTCQLLYVPDLLNRNMRRPVLVALLRLSAAYGLYPQCLTVEGIVQTEQLMLGGQFGEVRKGLLGNEVLCLKVPRMYQRSERGDVQSV